MVLFASLVFVIWVHTHDQSTPRVTIANQTWVIAGRAVTDEERALGLSYRSSFPEANAWLFWFPTPDRHGFWMKDMSFPLDMVFIHGTVVDSVARNRQPGDLTPVFPRNPVDIVLEVNAGEASQIQAGDLVQFDPPLR